jgi:hypothetical protein
MVVGKTQQHLKPMFVPHQLLYFKGLRCCCVCPTAIALLYFTGLRCCCVCPTTIVKAIGVGQT